MKLPGIATAVAALAIMGVGLGLGPGSARAAEPMTFQELSLRLRMGDNPQVLLHETMQRKLLEPLTADQQAALKAQGVSQDWIGAVNSPNLAASPADAEAFRALKKRQQEAAAASARQTPTPEAPNPAQSETAPLEKLRESELLKVGDRAPDFTAKTTDGKEISLTQPARRLTVLAIVSTKSPPCAQLLTIFESSLQAKLGAAGVSIVALGSGDSADELGRWGRELKLTFTLAEDPGKTITARYARDYVPHCYVISREGIVKFTSVGLNKEDLMRMINIINSEH